MCNREERAIRDILDDMKAIQKKDSEKVAEMCSMVSLACNTVVDRNTSIDITPLQGKFRVIVDVDVVQAFNLISRNEGFMNALGKHIVDKINVELDKHYPEVVGHLTGGDE